MRAQASRRRMKRGGTLPSLRVTGESAYTVMFVDVLMQHPNVVLRRFLHESRRPGTGIASDAPMSDQLAPARKRTTTMAGAERRRGAWGRDGGDTRQRVLVADDDVGLCG